MKHVVIDTNVFVESVFGAQPNPSAVLMSNLDDLEMRGVYSQETIGELLYILKRECNKMLMDESSVTDVLMNAIVLFKRGKSTNTKYTKSKSKRPQAADPDDQMFVDAALAGNATMVITNDLKSGIFSIPKKHFNTLTPAEVLKRYHSKQQGLG